MATCSECTYLNLEKEHDHDGKFWCEFKYEWLYPECAECWRFCRAYSRFDQVAQSYRDYSKQKQSSGGCFITTMLCEILGLDDSTFYLQILRLFRNNYLQKNSNTIKILEEYDFIGPLIARNLSCDKNKKVIAYEYFCKYIIPICNDICCDKYCCEIGKYVDMTSEFINMYNLGVFKLTVPCVNSFDYSKDYSSYGHGMKKISF